MTEVLAIKNLMKRYDNQPLFDDLSLHVQRGELVVLTGRSGCGKSTLLKIIAGIDTQQRGDIYLHGSQVNTLESRQGMSGYMPQSDALLPWRNLLDNVILGQEIAGKNTTHARQQARELLPVFGLEGSAKKLPSALSGGMKRRAALLRTWLAGNRLLLLDEPFSGLDSFIKQDIHNWMQGLRKQLETTIVMVSHDVEEAVSLADRILVLAGTPATIKHEEIIHHQPATERKKLAHKHHIFKHL